MNKEAVWQWGLQIIEAVQRLRSPLLDSLMGVLTLVGTEEFYILLVCCLLWCGRPGVGLRLAGWLAFTGFVNALLKSWLGHPRPFELAPEVQLIRATGYGLPSGHAQAAVVVWGYLAFRLRRPWLREAAVLLILLIGFSRVYLGVHFPTDILAGWAVGVVLLALALVVERLPTPGMRTGRKVLLLLGVGLPIVAAAHYPVAGVARPLGLLAGFVFVFFGWGIDWNRSFQRKVRMWRLLSGLAGLLLLESLSRWTLSRWLPDPESTGRVAGAFGAGFVLGLWLFLGSFRLFEMLGLVDHPRRKCEEPEHRFS